MWFKSSEIPELSEVASFANPAMEMREIVQHAVKARRDLGKAEAVHRVARELGLNSRRVLAILHGEISRVWADEHQSALAFAATEYARQEKTLEHEIEVCRLRRNAAIESLNK